MPIENRCRRCGGRKTVTDWNLPIGQRHIEITCPTCAGTGVGKSYRTKLTLSDKEDHGWESVLTWPRFGRAGHCTVCDLPLVGRQRTFCSGNGCKGFLWRRLYEGIHWQKRHVCVRDGSVCQRCGEVFESPLVPGGPIYPEPSRLELDHIIPLHKGGGENPENLQLLCRSCHRDKTTDDLRPTKQTEKLFDA